MIDPIEICITCEVVEQYVSLASDFVDALSQALMFPMWLVFLAMSGIWIVIHGIKMIIGKGDLLGLGHEFVFVFIAALLVGAQGAGLISMVYDVSLSIMGSAARVALSVGATAGTGEVLHPEGMSGMVALVRTAEQGVFKVFKLAEAIGGQIAWTNPVMPVIYALLLIIPYFLVLIVYFAQVVVSIFRVMMLAALSPILMMAFGFGWGRGMAQSGIKALIAAFMVLFGASIALAVLLYGATRLGIAQDDMGSRIREIMSLTNPEFLTAVALGWLGTAFMTEATGMANSIAGSQLSNTAIATITGGAVATGLAAGKPAMRGAKAVGEAFVGKLGQGAGYAGAAVAHHAAKAMDRIKNPGVDRG